MTLHLLPPPAPPPLTVHVDGLLAGEEDAGVELPHDELLLSGLEDVLHLPAVVQVGAVEADAEQLLLLHRGSRAEGLGHLPGALAPVAGGHRRHGEGQSHDVEGEGQGRPAPVLQPHGPGRARGHEGGRRLILAFSLQPRAFSSQQIRQIFIISLGLLLGSETAASPLQLLFSEPPHKAISAGVSSDLLPS